MAYNKNTDWDNESKYLNNLIQNGNAGQKAWASNQMNALNAAQAQYGGTSNNNSSSYTPTTSNTSSGGSGGYTIGSKLGQQKAQDMPINGTYTASDGSVWTKGLDGTISVNHNGVITNNAYTPSDIGKTIEQQVAAKVPYYYVQDSVNARVEKATSDPNLYQYAYDDTYKYAMDYINSMQQKYGMNGNETTANNQQFTLDQLSSWLNGFMQQNPKPVEPQSDPRIDELLNQILTREDFSYDLYSDPLYKQYSDIYQREGDRAMRDTLAEVAAGAGGMNSYAITAAQQAANYYNSQLGDKIPELAQLAYDMYLKDKDSEIQNLGILQDMDETQYNRYLNTMNNWSNDRSFAYGMVQDAINQGNWQTQYDFNSMWADKNFANENYWANRDYNSNQSQIELENSRQDREDAQKEIKLIISASAGGATVPSELITRSGWSQATIDALIAEEKANNKKKEQKGNEGGIGYVPKGDDPVVAEPEFKLKGVMDLGLKMPAPSETYILSLADAGLVNIAEDGTVTWKDGVNAQNYQQILQDWQASHNNFISKNFFF